MSDGKKPSALNSGEIHLFWADTEAPKSIYCQRNYGGENGKGYRL